MRYCEFCGTQLEEGQGCTCPEAVEYKKQQKGIMKVGPFKQGMKDLLDVLIHPRKGIGKYVVSDSLWASLIAIFVQAALNGLMALFLVNMINNALSSTVNSIASAIVGIFGQTIEEGVTVSLFHGAKVFFLTFGYSLVMSVVFSLLIFIVAKIAREDKINLLRCFNVSAARAMLCIPITVLCTGIAALIPPVGIFLFGFFFYMVLIIVLCHAFDECDKIKPDMKIYLVPIIVVIVKILFIVLLILCWRSYVPTSIEGPIELVQDIVGMFSAN